MNTLRISLTIAVVLAVIGGVFPLLVMSQSRGNFTLYTPNSMLNNSFWLTAPIKIVTSDAACHLINATSDLEGAILVFTNYGAMGCQWESLGPVGVIFPGSTYPQRPAGYHYIYLRRYSLQLPRGQISLLDIPTLQEIVAMEPDLQGIFSNGDHNEWREMNQSVLCITLFAIVVACSLAAAILALVKLGRIIAHNGHAFSVPQISLGLIALGSMVFVGVFLYLIVRNLLDIVGYLEVFVLFLAFGDACQTLACLAICVFWYDIMTDLRGAPKKKISKRIAVPLIVAASIIVILLLLLPFTLIVPASEVIKVLTPAGYFVVAVAISISWLILGSKLLKSLKNNAAVSDNKRKMIKTLSNKIFITTALFFATRVLEIAWTVCELIYTPPSAVITLVMGTIFNVATNAMLSQVFSVPKNDDKGITEGVKLTEQNKPLN